MASLREFLTTFGLWSGRMASLRPNSLQPSHCGLEEWLRQNSFPTHFKDIHGMKVLHHLKPLGNWLVPSPSSSSLLFFFSPHWPSFLLFHVVRQMSNVECPCLFGLLLSPSFGHRMWNVHVSLGSSFPLLWSSNVECPCLRGFRNSNPLPISCLLILSIFLSIYVVSPTLTLSPHHFCSTFHLNHVQTHTPL